MSNPPTNSLNSLPSMTVQSSSFSYQFLDSIPHYLATAMAVLLLSPVTILTLTPDCLQISIDSLTAFLSGSLIPTSAKNVRSLGNSYQLEGATATCLYAMSIVLSD